MRRGTILVSHHGSTFLRQNRQAFEPPLIRRRDRHCDRFRRLSEFYNYRFTRIELLQEHRRIDRRNGVPEKKMMAKWDSRYELGNERIDSEHRVFIGLIIDFEEAVKQGAARERLHRILDELAKYVDYHFLREENLMTDCQYPDQKHHARMHNILLEDFVENLWKFRREVMAADELLQFLLEWFGDHVLGEDKKLVGYIGKSFDHCPAREG